MANPVNSNQIIGAFQDTFEKVGEELKQIPKDVGQAAMESVGITTGGKKQGNKPAPPGAAQDPGSAWQQIDQTEDIQIQRAIARNALEEINRPSAPKQPDEYEQRMQEEEQKKEAKEQQKKQMSAPVMPSSGARKVPGLKAANKAKQHGSEQSKNARQD